MTSLTFVQQPAFGRRLKALRTARDLSQRALADGRMAPSYISLLESGHRQPTLDVLVQLSFALGVSTEELVGAPLDFLRGPGAGAKGTASGPPGGEPQTCEVPLARGTPQELLELVLADDLSGGGGEYAAAMVADYALGLSDEPLSLAVLGVGFHLSDALAARGDAAARQQVLHVLARSLERVEPQALHIKTLIDLAAAARDAGDLVGAWAAVVTAAGQLPGSDLRGTAEEVRLLAVQLSVRCESGAGVVEVEAAVAELLEAAARVHSVTALGRAYWAAGTAYSRLNRTEPAVRYLLEAGRLLGGADLRMSEVLHLCTALASMFADLEIEVEAAGRYLEAAAALVALGDRPRGRIDAIRARYELLAGDPGRAEQLARTLLSGDVTWDPPDLAGLEATRGRALLALGRTEEGIEQVRSAAICFEQVGYLRQSVHCWRLLDRAKDALPPRRPGGK